MYELMKLAALLGGNHENIARAQSLKVEIVWSSASALEAIVRDGDALHAVYVRRSFTGQCDCGAKPFCAHMGAAALTWIGKVSS